ncbi:mitogen-activated protein kinase smk1 [Monosporozyma unispora]|nr:mitogen-activated protein kinase smk1 [Kazachstania unispora]
MDNIHHLQECTSHKPIQENNLKRRNYTDIKFSVPQRYEIIKVLGKGSYGIVCSIRDNHSTNSQFIMAIKKITNIFNKEILLKRAIRELKFMFYFQGHQNIVNFINVEIIFNRPYDGLYCYQELIDYDLAKVIHSDVIFTEFHIQWFTYQILCGVKYIHSANVIHRDLKPGNILCTVYGTLKICDFGLARGIAVTSNKKNIFNKSNTIPHITNYVATRWYRAPELILSNNSYDGAIDIWAIGCILAEFYHRRPIFMGKDSMHQIYEIIKYLGSPPDYLLKQFGSIRSWNMLNNQTINPENMVRGQNWKACLSFASSDAIDLLNRLLTWDPAERWTVKQAIEHPFVMSVRHIEDEPDCPHGSFDFDYESELDSMNKLRQYLIDEVIKFRNSRQ